MTPFIVTWSLYSPGPPLMGPPLGSTFTIWTQPRPPPATEVTPFGILAADYGLKARSASGIRGDDLEDWPCTSDPDDRTLVLSLHPPSDALHVQPGD